MQATNGSTQRNRKPLPRVLHRLAVFLALVLAVVALWWSWVLLRDFGRVRETNVFDEMANAVEDANPYIYILHIPIYAPIDPLGNPTFKDTNHFDTVIEDWGDFDCVEFVSRDMDKEVTEVDTGRYLLSGNTNLRVWYEPNGDWLLIVNIALGDDEHAIKVDARYEYNCYTKVLTRSDGYRKDSKESDLHLCDKALFDVLLPIYFNDAGVTSAFSANDLGDFDFEDSEGFAIRDVLPADSKPVVNSPHSKLLSMSWFEKRGMV